ncbi:MAG: phenylacetate--CoA ligase family protein [Pirellulales bacterium]
MSEFAAEFAVRRRIESLDRAELERRQLAKLNALLDDVLPANAFYARKFAGLPRPIRSLDEFRGWPTTTKDEFAAAPEPGMLAANQTWPTARYARYHQTSGTRGRPQIVLETRDDWRWWNAVWQFIFDAADVRPGDRVLMAFSFGPFIGFWSAFDAAVERGCLLIPAGGLSTRARLDMLRATGANVVLCTPSYALHMAEVAAVQGIDAAALGVRRLVLAGEPGGSIPAVRARLRELWNAEVHDHAGATEVGPWGYGDDTGEGLYVMEDEFLAEFVRPGTDEPAVEGETAELIVTGLGRRGCPCIRYRTRDLVKPIWNHDRTRRFVFLAGGVLGRADDMLVVRGVNIFPSSIDAVVREFSEAVEYRATVSTVAAMDQIALELEASAAVVERVAETLRSRLGLKIDVVAVAPGGLPRFEGKGKRWIDRRGETQT